MVNGHLLIRRYPPAGLRADLNGWSEYHYQEGRIFFFYYFPKDDITMSHSVKHVGEALCGTAQCHCAGCWVVFFLLLLRLGFTETSKDVSCPAFCLFCAPWWIMRQACGKQYAVRFVPMIHSGVTYSLRLTI